MKVFSVASHLPSFWTQRSRGYSFIVITNKDEAKITDQMQALFKDDLRPLPLADEKFLIRHYLAGVSNPVAESLARVLKIPSEEIRIDLALKLVTPPTPQEMNKMEGLWKEPAIERLFIKRFSEYCTWIENLKIPVRTDDSFANVVPQEIGLEFSPAELTALTNEAKKQSRSWTRAEWELFAQTWSEHCKHKIFNADILIPKDNVGTDSIFKKKLRDPALKIAEEKKGTYLSLFHDNAGVVRIFDPEGKPTSWAIAAKMETHNSPSAISPYGGASTGVVGVHRDILGTGLGALPIANWDVLCFETDAEFEKKTHLRPKDALSPEIIRKGVIRGIQDGGNQSGIPTVQGSVVFDPSYAVKPLVFAGALGILPVDFVNKKAEAGDKIFVIGGATGADGLRGAVMSSRDIRSEDFAGSIVQVANPYTQRCVTDFLMEARDRGLLSAVTDNGAGGLASSVGEMAQQTNGATIDLSNIRLKFRGLLDWEKLLSESQERMTLATRQPAEVRKLLEEWGVEFDEIGELTNSGRFIVTTQNKSLVDVDLKFLHSGCPGLKLTSNWSFTYEKQWLANESTTKTLTSLDDFLRELGSSGLTSREGIVRRFDHEVQGRTLRKPFGGLHQESPQDGTLLEVFEASAYVALGHGLAPTEKDFLLSVLLSFDEAMKKYLLATGTLATAGLLDNYSWPDPICNDRSLWKLQASGDILNLISLMTKIPFVSGKDSMKNNDAKFRILETLVISAVGSARGPEFMPSSYFLQPHQKIYNWLPLDSNIISRSENYNEAMVLVGRTIEKLNKRYELLESWIKSGALLTAKDYSAKAPLKSIFEMCLGRKIGIEFENSPDRFATPQKTLGALHLIFADGEPPAELINEFEFVGTTTSEFRFKALSINANLIEWRVRYRAGESLWT